MLSHQQKSHELRGRQCTGSGEAQFSERVKLLKIFLVKADMDLSEEIFLISFRL
jgi:hypothetical protein